MNNLEKLSLITRHINRDDKRKWNFKLSSKGEEILTKILVKKEKALSNLFQDFSKKEKATLKKTLQKLQGKLQTTTKTKLPSCLSATNK